MGITLGGPYNVITGPVLVELGKHPSITGKHNAVATVVGVIEGLGSIAAAII